MSEGTQMVDSRKGPQKRKRTKSNKKLKMSRDVAGMKVKVDWRMKKLFEKRAREYNSDDDEQEEEAEESMGVVRDGNASFRSNKEIEDENFSEGEGEDELGEGEGNEDWDDEGEDDHIQPGITKFTEGCRAFKMAFKSIIKKSVSDKTLGPVLSAQKKLVAEKLAEEEAERKVKGEAKKEKHLVGEKGHVKPANYLDSHEKFLIGVATKGVVKLFNAVNKAQNAQKGLNPSRSKDAKAIKKRRKEAFFSELGGTSSAGAKNPAKVHTSKGAADEGPAWAPLRDNYMLTNSKLKNWDKLQDTRAAADEMGPMSEDSSSEDD